MLGDRPPRAVDEAIAIGERLSALILTVYLGVKEIAARAGINGAEVIVTDGVFGNANPIMEATRKKAHNMLRPLLDGGVIPVVTGFNGSATVDGRPTTLGRGGIQFLRFHSGRGPGRGRTVDLDRRGRNHEARTRAW